jgi:acyl CoA:acetate/3-ketoacid CoA transferase
VSHAGSSRVSFLAQRVGPRKVISAEGKARLIGDGAFAAIQGSAGGVGEPTRLLRANRERILIEGMPRHLTVCQATGLGD